jgi:hypothetical protein
MSAVTSVTPQSSKPKGFSSHSRVSACSRVDGSSLDVAVDADARGGFSGCALRRSLGRDSFTRLQTYIRQMRGRLSKALACMISGLASGLAISMSLIRSVIAELYLGTSGMR